jgi:hypothetical protein
MNHKDNQSVGLPLYVISFTFFLAILIAVFMPYDFNVLVSLMVLFIIIVSAFFLYRDNFKSQPSQWNKHQKIQYYTNDGKTQNEILAKKMFLCPNCNFKLFNSDQFCSNCGIEV